MKRLFMLMMAFVLCLAFVSCAYGEAARIPATEYAYNLAPEESLFVENMIFTEPVTISGDYGQIIFANCEFQADIINTADFYTRVMILPDSEVGGKFILRNNMKEATMETPLPKFIMFAPVETVCEDCVGVVVSFGSFDVVFNGETYAMKDATLYLDNSNPEAGFVAYEGQEANVFVVGQWWENGEKVMMLECEYDPSM